MNLQSHLDTTSQGTMTLFCIFFRERLTVFFYKWIVKKITNKDYSIIQTSDQIAIINMGKKTWEKI